MLFMDSLVKNSRESFMSSQKSFIVDGLQDASVIYLVLSKD